MPPRPRLNKFPLRNTPQPRSDPSSRSQSRIGTTQVSGQSASSPSSAAASSRARVSSASNEKTKLSGWANLKTLSKLLDKGSSIAGPFKTVIDELIECIEVYESVGSGRNEFKKLQDELEEIFQDLQQHFSQGTSPIITASIENLCRSIDKEVKHVKAKQDRSSAKRLLEAREDPKDLLETYRRIQGHLQRLILNVNLSLWQITDEHLMDSRLDRLNPSFSACYNSRQATELRRGACTPGTRIDVLAQMCTWAHNPAAGRVYWINGMAGTGKTTIAYSVCDELRKTCNLGASFFCSRLLPECRDVNQIVPSIAYQLAEFSRPFRCALARILGRERNAHTQLLHTQFDTLILKPLIEARHTLPMDLVVVIDALDECNDRESTGRILKALFTKPADLPIKFLITSRPEPEIRDQIKMQGGTRALSRLVLHELDEGTVQDDIETYLRNGLAPIRPSNEEIMALVQRAGILFIYAATVTRYIGYNNFGQNPRKRLKIILDAVSASGNQPYRDIDNLYTLIVEAALNDPNLDDDDKSDRKLVLFTVLCAQEPLTISTISGLLTMEDIDRVHAALQPLWSVLHIAESSEVVTTLHASFPDYMFDPRRSHSNCCDPVRQHYTLAQRCFHCIRRTQPQFNICGLKSSYIPDNQVPNIGIQIADAISPVLFYSCRHWLAHLAFLRASPDLIELLDDFLSIRLLLWMEVMNLKKCMTIGVAIIQRTEDWAKRRACSKQLIRLAEDAWRFVAAFTFNPVSTSTCHIYVSMLPFWPRSTPIGKHYASRIRGPAAWGACVASRQFALLSIWPMSHVVSLVVWSPDGSWVTLLIGGRIQIHDSFSGGLALVPNGQSGIEFTSIACSPDSTRILSGSANSKLYLWDARSGKRILGPLTGHTGSVTSVAFSPNGNYLVSGSRDSTMRIRDAKTGLPLFNLIKARTGFIESVAFSPDSISIISGLSDDTVWIWDVQTGKPMIGPLAGQPLSISLSPDGTQIAFPCYINSVRVCAAQTGQTNLKLSERHSGRIRSVAFSPDSSCIISGSEDKTVILWDARDGRVLLGPLQAHNGPILSVSFSPDGIRFASASSDKTVCIWSARNKQDLIDRTESQHKPISSVSFSPHGDYIASGSVTGAIQVWDTRMGQPATNSFKGHTGVITAVVFSPDGARVASSSGSGDRTIRIWDLESGLQVLGPLREHIYDISSVAFSPDGAYIASGARWVIQLWDARSGRPMFSPLEGHTLPITSVVFSLDGAHIVSGSIDQTVVVWDVRTRQKALPPLRGHDKPITSVAVSPINSQILSGSVDQTIRVWDIVTGRTSIGPLRGHAGSVTSVGFSPDGGLIVSGSDDKTIRIWEAQTGDQLFGPLKGHTESVTSVAFSPRGNVIASGSSDGTLRVWDATNGQSAKPARHRLTWKMRADGWVVNKHTESDLLIWIPVDFRQNVKIPVLGSALWSSDDHSVTLDFENAWFGPLWSRCYKPPSVYNAS